MSDYAAPIADLSFCLRHNGGLDELLKLPAFADVDAETVDQVLAEAARFAADVLAPTNVVGDSEGCRVEARAVVIPDALRDAYSQFVANGWPALSAPAANGGMGLPVTVGYAAIEMWQTANLALSLLPMLTSDAAIAVDAHANEELRATCLDKLYSGEWSGTMCLTEPQAGSDLAAITTKAAPDGGSDGGRYRLTGTKIFITWGDQDVTDNVIHLVLARLPDAPDGVKGISLFLVPKYLPDADGNPGERNDVYPVSVEHKLGIHGSPTCVMNFGDGDGAVGWLVGPPNRGLACMFTMMNHARLSVGVQGLAISERAYQQALAYARDRVQGTRVGSKGRVTIVHHPDVRRMLMTMRAQIEAMRAVTFMTARLVDLEHHGADETLRTAAASRLALVTPIVKGWMTEAAQEVTSLGIQVHGGMGFVEETGAAQHYRDARILPIYEGTTGIQANDFCGRKILADEGREIGRLLDEMSATADAMASDESLAPLGAALGDAVAGLRGSVDWLLGVAADPDAVGAASVNLLLQAGIACGGWQLCKAALAAAGGPDDAFNAAKLVTARFYCEQILPRADAAARAAQSGPGATMALDLDQL